MWEARAEYADGTTIERYCEDDPRANDNDQQYSIECWLLSARKDCTWYSVNYVLF